MMEVKKQRLSSCKEAEKTPSRQNYAPFISKCPRFEQMQSARKESEARQHRNRPIVEESIKNSMKMLHHNKKLEQTQHYIFKSSSKRFDNKNIDKTPSPGDYEIVQQKRMKTLQQSPVKDKDSQHIQIRMCTLPTIPDKRNKFGVNFGNNEVSFVQKPESILQKQKQLMKKYRQSLSEDTPKLNKSGINSPSHPYTQLQRKVKAHLQGVKKQKENKQQMGRSQSESRIKIHHLYQYHPIDKNVHPLRVYAQVNKWQKKGKKTKFQFFDSSEKRFKDLYQNCCKSKQSNKASVRQYLQKLTALSRIQFQNI